MYYEVNDCFIRVYYTKSKQYYMLLPNSWTLEEKQVFHTCITMEFMECPNKDRTDAEVLSST